MSVDHNSAVTPLGIDEAINRFRRHEPVPDLEQIDLTLARHRILAEDVIAPLPVPAHDSSAMDGYAFRFTDLNPNPNPNTNTGTGTGTGTGTVLPVHGRVAAGHPLNRPLTPGTAVRIFTGGALPEGADTVAMQEHCTATNGHVTLPDGIRPGDHRRRAGEDVTTGSTVLHRGTRLRPQDIGAAASVGRTTLTVRRRLNVAVIATGDELRPPGHPLPPGCIYDTNRHTVTAALESLGTHVTTYPSVTDNPDTIRTALLTAAAENDLVITTGGVSSGEEDHIKAVIHTIGRLDFWKLPLKPGRPIAVGDVTGTPIVGLPGNPVSAIITFWLIGRPLVLHLAGAAHLDPTRYPVTAAFHHHRHPGRRELLRAQIRPDTDTSTDTSTGTGTGTGTGGSGLRAHTHPNPSSAALSSLTWSDGLVEIPENTGDIHPGDIVSFIPYHGLD